MVFVHNFYFDSPASHKTNLVEKRKENQIKLHLTKWLLTYVEAIHKNENRNSLGNT